MCVVRVGFINIQFFMYWFFFARGNKRRDQNEAEAVVSNYNEADDVTDKQDSSFRYRYLKLIEDLAKRRRGEEMRLGMTFRGTLEDSSVI